MSRSFSSSTLHIYLILGLLLMAGCLGHDKKLLSLNKENSLPIRLPHNLRFLSGFSDLQHRRPVGTLHQGGVCQVLAMSEMTPIDRSDD